MLDSTISCRIKVIISSRWMDVFKSLENFGQISLESSRNRQDIEHFVREIIDEKIDDGSIIINQLSMAEEIKRALIEKSDGM